MNAQRDATRKTVRGTALRGVGLLKLHRGFFKLKISPAVQGKRANRRRGMRDGRVGAGEPENEEKKSSADEGSRGHYSVVFERAERLIEVPKVARPRGYVHVPRARLYSAASRPLLRRRFVIRRGNLYREKNHVAPCIYAYYMVYARMRDETVFAGVEEIERCTMCACACPSVYTV